VIATSWKHHSPQATVKLNPRMDYSGAVIGLGTFDAECGVRETGSLDRWMRETLSLDKSVERL